MIVGIWPARAKGRAGRVVKFELVGGLNNFYRRRIVSAALQLAANACGVEFSEVVAVKRSASVAFARQLAMYLCHIVGDMSLRDIATEFDRDRTTVSHACHAIEDRRDCPIFDRQIDHLEQKLRAQVRSMLEEAGKSASPEKKSVVLAG